MSICVVLKSSDSTNIHKNNSSHDFRVHLPRPLDLDGTWNVSLLEFTALPSNGQIEVFVCSDLCDDTFVGDKELPLLRRVWLKKSGNIIYQVPFKVPLRICRVQDVHIYIRDRHNRPASFLQGDVTVTLLFQKTSLQ
jgi:hypothetical protein